MKLIYGHFFFLILLWGCQENQLSNKLRETRGLKQAIAKDLNNKAERFLDFNPDSAQIFLDSALKFDSNNYIIYFNKGHVYISKKEYLNAINDYKIMLTKNPDFAQGITFLGMLYEKTGKFDSAKLEYTQAMDVYNFRLRNQESIQNEDKIFRVFTLYLLDSSNSKKELENLFREMPQIELLKILRNSTRHDVINGFLPD